MIADNECDNHKGEGKFFFSISISYLIKLMNLDVIDDERDNHKGFFFLSLYIIYLNL